MASPTDFTAITIDRLNELFHHTGIALALIVNKIVALPCQTTLAPVLSLPLILADLVKGDKVHVLPTPFTEAIVYEITEIIKYLRPDYQPE